MSDDTLPPTPTVTPPSSPARAKNVECEFCGCTLDSTGAILKRGDGARKYLEQEDTIRDVQKALDTARREVAELRASLVPSEPVKKRLDLLGG